MYSNPSVNPLPHLDYRWVFLASLLVSAWLIALDPLINRDAIIYLRAADAYLQDGFAASQQHFGRPLLSICMALIHQLTGLPLIYAGLAITTLFYGLLCTSFVATVHTLGGNRSVQLIAAVVILAQPMLNDTRSAIMRDPAYWALLMLSFRELLLYLRYPKLKHQARWFACIVLACLFRFEGLFFAAFAPLALLFTRDLPKRGRHCLHLLIPQLVTIGAALTAILFYASRLGPDATLFPSIGHYIDRLTGLPDEFTTLASNTGQSLLQFTSREDASIAVVAALAAILLLNLCRAMTWPWVLTLLWGWRTRLLQRFRPDDAVLLQAHLLIALSYLAVFVLINRFMLERYSNQAVIFLLLYVPFILNSLWHSGGWRKVVAILLLLGMSADTLHNHNSDKVFIREAAQWVKESTPQDATVVTNAKTIAYFSKRDVDWPRLLDMQFRLDDILSNRQLWEDANYLVVYIRPHRFESWNAWLESNSLEELRTFQSGRKGKVSVVLLQPNTP